MTTTQTLPLNVRYFAAASEAAGTESDAVELPADATIAQLRATLGERHGSELTRVLGLSAFLVDGRADLPQDTPLADVLPSGGTVDVLPPFAGG